jgi:hypothetical protein
MNMDKSSATSKFLSGFKWNLFGSISYESIKALHCFLLLNNLQPHVYGFLGSLFATVYLATYIADFGATNSIPPFSGLFTRSQSNLKQFLLKYSLLPHIPIVLAAATVFTFLWSKRLTIVDAPPYLFIVPGLIIFETMRSFLRQFLHTTFQSRITVIVEVALMIGYFAAIWGPHWLFGYPLTLNLIFLPHLLDSILAVSILIFLVIRYRQTLPTTPLDLPTKIGKRLTTTKTFNYLLRVSRNMFTSNFLTPLFASKFGLQSAGMFYFASTLANTTQSIVKAVISYSGGALLANLKDAPQQEKKEAFRLISEKLMHVVAPVIIFLTINHQAVIRLGYSQNITGKTLSLGLLFLIISFTEFFFILYEQFYIIEEASNKLFIFKILEISIFYGLIAFNHNLSLVSTLISVIIIRFMSLSIIAINAFYLWRIMPNFKTNLKYLALCFAASLLCLLIL